MRFYEVLVADSKYHKDEPLTYSWDGRLPPLSVVSIPLRQRLATGFILQEVARPTFETRPIKTLISDLPLPEYCLELAKWLSRYYNCSLAEALRQYAPSRPIAKAPSGIPGETSVTQLEWSAPLTPDQKRALQEIQATSGTVLLHGETGSGKTRVYLELASKTLKNNCSVLLLTPEISLTSQLAQAAQKFLGRKVFIVHSQLGAAGRKKIWQQILETTEPVVVVGPRSALFLPIKNIGLIVLDEAHEPAYKQSQSPRYHAVRVASQLGKLTGAKVVLGTATPAITDYYLALSKKSVVRMDKPAITPRHKVNTTVVDLKDGSNFTSSRYLSNPMLNAIKSAMVKKQQALIYLNRRGSARLILCSACGWQLSCPNCDAALVYHSDEHLARCHSCGYKTLPPTFCPVCKNTDITYRSIGTKALADELKKAFPHSRIARFDSDNTPGERLNEVYDQVAAGRVDILVGTQLLAKGLDLPKLSLVGIVSAETSLGIPDFTSEERAFQLLYQVAGRVGRGHAPGQVVIQTYDPASIVIQSAAERKWDDFYAYELRQRQKYRFPPYSYLALLICRRASAESARSAALAQSKKLAALGLPMEIIGPVQPFYARKGQNYYCQLVLKAKQRSILLEAVKITPSNWQIDLDPSDLI